MFYKVAMLLAQGVTFAILPLIAKELGNEQYSVWSLSYGFVQLLIPYIVLQLDGAFTRFMSGEEDKENLRNSFISLLLIVLSTSLGIIVAMCFFSKPLSFFLYKDTSYEFLVPIVAIWVATKGALLFIRNYFRTRAQFKFDMYISIAQQIALVGGIVFLLLTSKTITRLFYVVVTNDIIIIFLCLILIIKDLGGIKFRFKIPKEYFRYAIPLIPVTALSWAIDYSDQFFNVHYLGHDLNARYSIYYLYSRLPHWIIVTPWHYAFFPFICRIPFEGEGIKKTLYYIKESMNWAFIGITALLAGLLVFGSDLIFLIGNQVANKESILLISTIGFTVYLSAFYQIMYHLTSMQKKTHNLIFIYLGGALINIVFNLILIEPMGILGAAISTLISFSAIAILTFYFAGTKIDELLYTKTLGTLWASLAVISVVKFIFVNSLVLSILLFACELFFILKVVQRFHPDYFAFAKDKINLSTIKKALGMRTKGFAE